MEIIYARQVENRLMIRDNSTLFLGVLPPPVGGTTISFLELTDAVEEIQAIRVFDLGSLRRRGGVLAVFKLILALLDSRVWSLHSSDKGSVVFGPFLFVLARLLGKKIVFRLFGGEFHETYENLGYFKKWAVLHTVLSSDLLYVQTPTMCKYFRSVSVDINVRWLPTSRVNRFASNTPSIFSEILVVGFVGRVCKEKGILELLEAVENVDGCELRVYGPCADQSIHKKIEQCERASYFGEVQQRDLGKIYSSFSLFALPSYYNGEGFSGSVIEAMMSGLPLLLTRWKALPEMVSENSAFFVDIRSGRQIRDVLAFAIGNRHELKAMSDSSRRESYSYERDFVLGKFLSEILSLR